MASRRRSTKSKKKAAKETPAFTGRVGLLYGLSGLFVVVVGGLVALRPGPLMPSPRSASVLTATREPDAIDSALSTNAPLRTGVWKRLAVRHLTWDQVQSARPHFTVSADAGSGVALTVGSDWLTQQTPDMASGEIVLAVVGDESDARVEATVNDLVDRLCARLRLSPRQVRWS